MRITFLGRILWLLAFAAANLYAAEEQDLIATLQSSASTPTTVGGLPAAQDHRDRQGRARPGRPAHG